MVKYSGAENSPLDVLVESSPDDGVHPVAFDDRGMPNTVAAGNSMTEVMVKAALIASVAKLQRRSVANFTAASTPSSDGSPSLDSMEVVWLIAEFSKPFGSAVVDVSKIPDRIRWSSAGALASLIAEGVK
jgi:hypothetical protein